MFLVYFFGLICIPDVFSVLMNVSTSLNYVIQGSCNFLSENSLCFTAVSSLGAKGIVVIEI